MAGQAPLRHDETAIGQAVNDVTETKMDVDAWVDAVYRLTQDADLWRFLTRAGKDIVRTSPDAGDRARAYVELREPPQ